MIDVDVPNDIRRYDPKFLGPFTKRQFVCTVLAVVVVISVRVALGFVLTGEVVSLFAAAAGLPFALCGYKKVQGLPLEKYVSKILMRNIKANAVRKSIVTNRMECRHVAIQYDDETPKEKQARLKLESKQKKLAEKRKKKGWKPKLKGRDYKCYL